MYNTSSPRLDDAAVEVQVKAKGLDAAPRVTKDQIDALVARVQYVGGRVASTTSTVVHAFLDGTFLLASGHSACVSAENFDVELGFNMARGQAEAKARDQLWALEGYALRKQLTDIGRAGVPAPTTFVDRMRVELGELNDKLTRLQIFIGTERFNALPPEEREDQRDQMRAMQQYSTVLTRRLARAS